MSVQYQAIGWNRQKRLYDSVIAAGVFGYLAIFVGAGALVHPNATIETLLIRGFGTAALLLLHIILCIGPLCRLSPRFLPLLYNRRHLGVARAKARNALGGAGVKREVPLIARPGDELAAEPVGGHAVTQ